MFNINDILSNSEMRKAIIEQLAKEEQWVRYSGEVTWKRIRNGEVVQTVIVNNLVVNTGLYHIADRLAEVDETAMGWAAIGTNNTAPASGDTALIAEVGRVALTSKVQGTGGNANKVTYTATFPAGTGTGTIVEAGIFNASSGGIMLSRSLSTAIPKGAGDALAMSWVLTATAA